MNRSQRALAWVAAFWFSAGAAGAGDGNDVDRRVAGLAGEMRYADGQTWQPMLLALNAPEGWRPDWTADDAIVPVNAAVPLHEGLNFRDAERLLGMSSAPQAGPRFAISTPVDRVELATLGRALAAIAGHKMALVLGIRTPGEKPRYVVPVSPHDRGTSAPIFPFEPRDLPQVLADGLAYLRLTRLERLDDATWSQTLAIRTPEIRFVAVRDVVAASFGRGLSHAPVEARSRLISSLVAATGDPKQDAAFHLRAALVVSDYDRSAESCALVVGEDVRWWIDAVALGSRELCAAALGAASTEPLAKFAARVAGDLVVAYLERGDGLGAGEIALARRILASAPVSAAPLGSRAASLVDGLIRSQALPVGVEPIQVARVFADLGRVYPGLGGDVAAMRRDQQEALRAWSARIAPRTAEEEAALEAFRSATGVRPR